MQCVILAAGSGSRMGDLTENTPKQLVHLAGKPLLDHLIEALPSAVTEIIMVTNYLEEQLHEYYGSAVRGVPVKYVHQPIPEGEKKPKGTADALLRCQEYITGRFMFMFADDVHGKKDLQRAVEYERSMLTLPVEDPSSFGVVQKHSDDTLADIVEKPQENPPSNLASTGVFVLDKHIFEYEPQSREDGELCHTSMVRQYAKKYPIKVLKQRLWLPVNSQEQLAYAEEELQKLDKRSM